MRHSQHAVLTAHIACTPYNPPFTECGINSPHRMHPIQCAIHSMRCGPATLQCAERIDPTRCRSSPVERLRMAHLARAAGSSIVKRNAPTIYALIDSSTRSCSAFLIGGMTSVTSMKFSTCGVRRIITAPSTRQICNKRNRHGLSSRLWLVLCRLTAHTIGMVYDHACSGTLACTLSSCLQLVICRRRRGEGERDDGQVRVRSTKLELDLELTLRRSRRV